MVVVYGDQHRLGIARRGPDGIPATVAGGESLAGVALRSPDAGPFRMFNQVVHFLLPERSLFTASIATKTGAVVGEKNDSLQGLSSGVDLGRKSKKELDLDGGSSAIHPEFIAGCSHERRRS